MKKVNFGMALKDQDNVKELRVYNSGTAEVMAQIDIAHENIHVVMLGTPITSAHSQKQRKKNHPQLPKYFSTHIFYI